jgi:membrane-associated protein
MSTLLSILITSLQAYGYPVLWLVVFVASVGAPLPTSLVLLAAGAFAALGDFDIALLMVITVSASACGDSTGYFIGRRWGSKVLKWLEQPRRRKLISANAVVRSRASFKRYGAWTIFLSRFLFSALGGVINLITGGELYPYPRFLLYDISGQILGAAIPLTLGYVFGATWEAVGDILSAFSGFAFAFLSVIVLAVLLVRSVQRSREGALIKNGQAGTSGEIPLIGGTEQKKA